MPWRQGVNRLTAPERGGLLILNTGEDSLEHLSNAVLKRNCTAAQMARELVDPDHLVVVPQRPLPRERLARELRERGLDDRDVWVYGLTVPERLKWRALKIQMHPPLPGDDVPAWFDAAFPERIREVALPGYACFTREKLSEAVTTLLDEYVQVRLKDPRGSSGEGQWTVGAPADYAAFVEAMKQRHGSEEAFDAALRAYGYVVEVDLANVRTWGFTLTETPRRAFASLGRQYRALRRRPNGSAVMEYGGTSAVTVADGRTRIHDADLPARVPVPDPWREAGGPQAIRVDAAVLHAAERYIEAARAWEGEGFVRTRVNVDVLQGMVQRRNGDAERLTGAVEGAGRPGGASPAELLGALDLVASPEGRYAVRSTRHVFRREQAETYRRFFDATGQGTVIWDGVDESWDGKYVMLCVY